MRKALFFTLCLVSTIISGAQTTERLDELMTAYAQQHHFNGAILVVYKGKVVLDKGYGFRNVKDSVLNDPSTIFQIGSITKQFTSTVIMKLQEEKKLSVRDKLSKYFPGYPKGDSVTIEQLLTHTSGIYSYTSNAAFMNSEVAKPASREKMISLFRDKPFDFAPGTGWNYSNSAYSLLGYIIEDVTHMTYEQAVRKYIFQKAGMVNSGFDFTHLSSPVKATGYFQLNEKGSFKAPVVDSTVSFSAGAIYTTTGDLYRWYRAVASNTVMSAASKARAFAPFRNNYGYGWITDTIAGVPTVGHSGGIHGFNSNMVTAWNDSTTVILLSNVSTAQLPEITRSIYALLYGKPYELPKERQAITLAEDILQQYIGIYDVDPLVIHIRLDKGKLICDPEGQGPLQLHAEKKDAFFLKEVDARIEFNRDDKGNVVSLTLYQNGAKLTGKKR